MDECPYCDGSGCACCERWVDEDYDSDLDDRDDSSWPDEEEEEDHD